MNPSPRPAELADPPPLPTGIHHREGRAISVVKRGILSGHPGTFSRLPPERAAALVGVDQIRDVAVGIFEGSLPSGRLLAIGRACRLPGDEAAELAFVVHEQWRRLGIVTVLFQVLVGLLRQRGVQEIVAQLEQDNPAMLRVFRNAGAEIAAVPGTNGLTARLRLTPASQRSDANPSPKNADHRPKGATPGWGI